MRKLCVFAGISIAALCWSTAAAMAGNPNGVVLSAPKTVAVNYTHCSDASGNPLPCVTVDYTLTNNTASTVNCRVAVAETGFTAFSGSLSAAQQVNGEVTTTYTSGMKSLTLVLSCNGTNVPGEKQKVRVLIS